MKSRIFLKPQKPNNLREMKGYSVFSKMGKRNFFLNLKSFHKTKSFGKAAFLKNAFG